MKKIIEQSYSRVEAPSPFREQLHSELLISSGGIMDKMGNRFWKKPGFLALIAVVIIVAVIIYGVWLPGSIEI